MIDLHTVATPNGHKISIMLEEVELPYRVVPYNIFGGDQFTPEFLALNPNNKLPVVVDHDPPGGGDPIIVFETGAILCYLAEKTGRLWPQDLRGRYAVLQWLMFQVSGLGPMHGQAHHFVRYAPEPMKYPTERYVSEALRQLRVMEKRLSQAPYLGGDAYSIADIACWPWIRAARMISVTLDAYPNLQRWFDTIARRPAVERGSKVINDNTYRREPSSHMTLDAQQWSALFGAQQHAPR